METERVARIAGEKYHMNRLSVDELNNMRAHAIAQISSLIFDVERIEEELAVRRPDGDILLDNNVTRGNFGGSSGPRV